MTVLKISFFKNQFQTFLYLSFLFVLLFSSCQKDRFRSDSKNRMTRKATIANDYLANQSIEITQSNIEKREVTDKKSRKKLARQQKELNEANQSSSKVKKPKRHSGNYKFY